MAIVIGPMGTVVIYDVLAATVEKALLKIGSTDFIK
jgi:hypothetical protein